MSAEAAPQAVAVNGDAIVAQLRAIKAGAQATIHQVDSLLLQFGLAQEGPGGVVNDPSEFGEAAPALPARFGRKAGE